MSEQDKGKSEEGEGNAGDGTTGLDGAAMAAGFISQVERALEEAKKAVASAENALILAKTAGAVLPQKSEEGVVPEENSDERFAFPNGEFVRRSDGAKFIVENAKTEQAKLAAANACHASQNAMRAATEIKGVSLKAHSIMRKMGIMLSRLDEASKTATKAAEDASAAAMTACSAAAAVSTEMAAHINPEHRKFGLPMLAQYQGSITDQGYVNSMVRCLWKMENESVRFKALFEARKFPLKGSHPKPATPEQMKNTKIGEEYPINYQWEFCLRRVRVDMEGIADLQNNIMIVRSDSYPPYEDLIVEDPQGRHVELLLNHFEREGAGKWLSYHELRSAGFRWFVGQFSHTKFREPRKKKRRRDNDETCDRPPTPESSDWEKEDDSNKKQG